MNKQTVLKAVIALIAGITVLTAAPRSAAPRDYRTRASAGAEDGAEVYKRDCLACHGKEGKGDGPAAVAFSPRPGDLSDAERMSAFTDSELKEIVTNGKGNMPGFSELLTPEELDAVLAYVGTLSGER